MVLVGETAPALVRVNPCVLVGASLYVHLCVSPCKTGALDFLERPTVVFVRLKEAVALDPALDAPLPVRFVFVLVGPSMTDMCYHETGRAMAALMADKVSERIAQ